MAVSGTLHEATEHSFNRRAPWISGEAEPCSRPLPGELLTRCRQLQSVLVIRNRHGESQTSPSGLLGGTRPFSEAQPTSSRGRHAESGFQMTSVHDWTSRWWSSVPTLPESALRLNHPPDWDDANPLHRALRHQGADASMPRARATSMLRQTSEPWPKSNGGAVVFSSSAPDGRSFREPARVWLPPRHIARAAGRE
jgi:hypothetical protein